MKKKTTQEQDIEIIQLYINGMSSFKIAEYFNNNFSRGTVDNILRKYNITKNDRKEDIVYYPYNGNCKATTEQESEIIQLYYSGMSQQSISEYFKGYLGRSTIRNILKNNNIQCRNRGAWHKDIFNEEYFTLINHQNKAYYIGLLLADGSISLREHSDPTIRIELNKRDKYIIEEFKSDLKSSNIIADTKKDCVSFRVTSQKMVNDLSQYYIIPQKTKTTQLPSLPEEYMPHLIRGLFDGDGWVSSGLTKSKKTPFGFCGSEMLVTQFRDYLVNKINLSAVKVGIYKDKIPQIIFNSKHDISAFYNYIYQDAEVYMSRKKDKFII